MLNSQLMECGIATSDDLLLNLPSCDEASNNAFLAKQIASKLIEIVNDDRAVENPLFLEFKPGFIDRLALNIVKNPHKSIAIGVSGESASGKTTLARKILDICVNEKNKSLYTIIPSDNYYKDKSQELKDAGSYEALFERGFSLDEPAAVDLELLRKDLLRIKSGKKISTPEYDFITIASIPHKIEKKPAKVILLEGLFVLENMLKEHLDVSIYVHTPADVIKDRWYKRSVSRGKTGRAADMLFEIVNKGAKLYVRPYAKDADIVISGVVSEYYIESVANKIKNAIREVLA
ncbi:MAG: hypothetical protein PHX18_03280 [Candidatus Gastranaerophilales bacterium]|nr:hypothetical protein [Candidatus Gastranaerophilales bacterium]